MSWVSQKLRVSKCQIKSSCYLVGQLSRVSMLCSFFQWKNFLRSLTSERNVSSRLNCSSTHNRCTEKEQKSSVLMAVVSLSARKSNWFRQLASYVMGYVSSSALLTQIQSGLDLVVHVSFSHFMCFSFCLQKLWTFQSSFTRQTAVTIGIKKCVQFYSSLSMSI